MKLHRFIIEHWATAIYEKEPELNRDTEILAKNITEAKIQASSIMNFKVNSIISTNQKWEKVSKNEYRIHKCDKRKEYLRVIKTKKPIKLKPHQEAGFCWQSRDYVCEKADRIIKEAIQIKRMAAIRELYYPNEHPESINENAKEAILNIKADTKTLYSGFTSSKTANREIEDE